MEFYENKQLPEQAVLLGVDIGEYDAEASLAELEALAVSAGAEVRATVLQKLSGINPATYLGTGRMEEVKNFCKSNEIDLIIADSELSPSQIKNIEDFTGVRTIDRTTLILDIFASRARSHEGKVQVELAQLKYSLPRLSGKGKSMSRLGAGIGTRGPGESKLESDRRHIRRRIYTLETELAELAKRRNRLRVRRQKDGIPTVAIVGYTNAGKSTLMNTLTGAGVLAEDKLFATLDPTARALTLPDGQKVMLVDTVGLVRRLPHHLVEAFKSTLEEAAQAQVILNVCDASDPACAEHLRVTAELLESLECKNERVISVMNKCDLVSDFLDLPVIGQTVPVSALEGKGLDKLLEAIEKALPLTRAEAELLLPFDKGAIAAKIRRDGIVKSEDFTDEGIRLRAVVEIAYLEEIRQYIVEKS